MRELSLFTGAGGGIWGTHLLGWRTVGYVEWDEYCQKVIAQRIADKVFDRAPIFGDIEIFIREGYAARYRGLVDVVSAGFPCQPFSSTGKRLAEADPRNMWPATAECIAHVRPRFALLENVPALASTPYFGRIIGDLTELGYDCRWTVISAGELGAPHLRRRLWIVADSESIAEREQANKEDAITRGREARAQSRRGTWRLSEPDLGRVVDELASGVQRRTALGNGQVPAVVAEAWERLSGANVAPLY